ncbi:CDP-glycerol glycerophosphotransferase family protein [Agromyces sp. H3Y2-19a]|uniref:CDP-glycerol glycerophosphotransferase family protein n=1 Tax=Agromyces TaxID=33877 RepID=UPI0023B9E266|nr:CDP-glycerol glycerophosphotransferase family protein [Agromyces chromiiresistens]MDF0514658.1 CDP-glycerol glycerophosphotransferase family protein [Agromyces chromiiresistens]
MTDSVRRSRGGYVIRLPERLKRASRLRTLRVAATLLAGVSAVAALSSSRLHPSVTGAALVGLVTCSTILAIGGFLSELELRSMTVPRIVVLAGVLGVASTRPELTSIAVAVLALALETAAFRSAASLRPFAAGLDGCSTPRPRTWPVIASARVGLLCALATILGVSWPMVAVLALVLGGASLLLSAGQLGAAFLARRRQAEARERFRPELQRLAPKFAVHWDAPTGTAYQLTMWMDELVGIGEPFVIVVRNQEGFDDAATAAGPGGPPVVLLERHDELDDLIVPSLIAIFYVNNAPSNTNCTRFSNLWHVQLNHGDSDKAPSYAPSLRQYDRNFVAGPAAARRFADHAVETTTDYFRIVGRPQLADVVRVEEARDHPTVVLYAPTWAGFNADTAVSSLGYGRAIVEELLAAGVTVHFRPHPHALRVAKTAEDVRTIDGLLRNHRDRTGTGHRLSVESARLDLVECFNDADALITDVSSVLTDFLASAKPYAIAMSASDSDAQTLPLATGGVVLSSGHPGLHAGIEALLGPDRHFAARERLCRDYLGPDPGSAASILRDEVRTLLAGPKRPANMR